MWEIRRYDSSLKGLWDDFVTKARNSTFLFFRDYMDYHSDRFCDFSLLGFRNGKLTAILPANIADRTLYSHQGLTYGGWVLPPGIDTTEIFMLWKEWLEFCGENEILRIEYKPVPYIYTVMPSEEDRYMLYLCNARIKSSNISTAIDLAHNPGFNKLQRRHLKQASEKVYYGIHDLSGEELISEFYDMLNSCLAQRHGVAPVHILEEIRLLMSRFPEIYLGAAYSKETDEMLAGVLIYETEICAHCQYIATTTKGREENALSFLFEKIINTYTRRGFRYFDFGTSNEDGGLKLNAGLNRQKTSYGGSGVAYQCFEINVPDALSIFPATLWP